MKTRPRFLCFACLLFLSTCLSRAGYWYVATNGNDAASGLDWDNAKATIQAAIDAAATDDTVWVSNGVYNTGSKVVHGAMANRVAFDKAILVRSVNGPAETIIDGLHSIRCAYVGTNATLSGFTLTHGATLTSGDANQEMSGGGAWCEASGILTNCVITGNLAAQNGGGAFNGTLNHCIVSGNAAGSDGGGAIWSTLNDCTLSGNSASNTGGGASWGTLNGCVLTANTAAYGGGGFRSTLTRCTLAGNTAAQDGGGAFWGTLNQCTLTGNTASNTGGGTFDAAVNHCILAENHAPAGGGAHSGQLNGCALWGNTANYGGGANGATLTNCTLAGNAATQSGGGTHKGTSVNGIIYFNTAPLGPNHYLAALSYSCTTPLPAGEGNLTNEPALASLSHLSLDSPCRGMGQGASATGTDIDGEAWNSPPAMGCDELRVGAVTGDLQVAIGMNPAAIMAGQTVTFHALVDGRTTASAWRWDDGSISSNQPVIARTFASPGIYTVVLTACNETHPLGVSATVQVAVGPIHFVSLDNLTPAAPYTNWSMAATNIQDAIDAASTGAVVMVSNGVYSAGGRAVAGTLTNRAAIDKPITVRSVNGPGVTTIQGRGLPGPSAVRCAYVGTNAVLSGFTLTGGGTANGGDAAREQSGGGAFCEDSGLLTNCVLTGNAAYHRGGGAYGGTLMDCTLATNQAPQGGGASTSILVRCTLTGNSASSGGGCSYGTLTNCTLTGNTAKKDGGGAYECTLTDCTLTGNTAKQGGGGGACIGTLSHCTLTGNSANYGGGTYAGTITDCTLSGNSASGNGGAACGGRLTRCKLTGNTAGDSRRRNRGQHLEQLRARGQPGRELRRRHPRQHPERLRTGGQPGRRPRRRIGCRIPEQLHADGQRGVQLRRRHLQRLAAKLHRVLQLSAGFPQLVPHRLVVEGYCRLLHHAAPGLGRKQHHRRTRPGGFRAPGPRLPCRGAGSDAQVSGTDIDGQAWAAAVHGLR